MVHYVMPHFIYWKDLEELSLQTKLVILSHSLGTSIIMVSLSFKHHVISVVSP